MGSTSFSPGVRRMMGRVGASEEGREDLEELASVRRRGRNRQPGGARAGILGEDHPLRVAPSPDDVSGNRRDRSAGPTQGRLGKDSAPAKTREAKLGRIFSQTRRDEQGRALQDPESTTYVEATEEAAAFGARIYTEAVRRGAPRAPRLVVLGDGTPWIWGIAEEHFHQAIQIVDLYHARERLFDLSKTVWGLDGPEIRQWVRFNQELLDRGDVKAVLASMRQLPAEDEAARKARRTSLEYFQKNAHRTRCACFRGQELFIGSGIIEAGCKTIIGQRLKQSGMRWTVGGANAIIALRCCQLSNRWEEFWEARSAG